MKRLAFTLVTIAALLAAGCGSGSRSGASTRLGVGETEYAISPATPMVRAGTITIIVTNDGAKPHGLLIERPGGSLQTPTLPPGESATLTVKLEAGSYSWYSPAGGDRARGMTGTLHVR